MLKNRCMKIAQCLNNKGMIRLFADAKAVKTPHNTATY
jgi:hypothetical protein